MLQMNSFSGKASWRQSPGPAAVHLGPCSSVRERLTAAEAAPWLLHALDWSWGALKIDASCRQSLWPATDPMLPKKPDSCTHHVLDPVAACCLHHMQYAGTTTMSDMLGHVWCQLTDQRVAQTASRALTHANTNSLPASVQTAHAGALSSAGATCLPVSDLILSPPLVTHSCRAGLRTACCSRDSSRANCGAQGQASRPQCCRQSDG